MKRKKVKPQKITITISVKVKNLEEKLLGSYIWGINKFEQFDLDSESWLD